MGSQTTLNIGLVMSGQSTTVQSTVQLLTTLTSLETATIRVIMPVANHLFMKDTTNWPTATMYPPQAVWDLMKCDLKIDNVTKVTAKVVNTGYIDKG